jgi:proteasome lid subunit RPN8/RPN11
VTPLLTSGELHAIQGHARADYPAECCGVVLVRTRGEAERRVLACRNIQDDLHAKDPGRFPRTARTAYYIAHEHLLEIGRRESEGFEVHVIYHSHVDAGAYFSETDRRRVRGGAADRRGRRARLRNPLTGPRPAAIIRLPL